MHVAVLEARQHLAPRRAVVLLFAASLFACATPPARDVAPAVVAAADTPFELSGRLSARHGENAAAASFHWVHAPGADELVLSTPFGQALARLVGNADGVALELPDGTRVRADDWESLTREALGIALPVRGLVWWVRAAPRPASAHTVERDAVGRAAVLRQDGWEIVYGYRDAGTRPSRVVLAYPNIDIRLALDAQAGEGAAR